MYNTRWTILVLLFGLMLASAPVVGQGLQTGVITGTVTTERRALAAGCHRDGQLAGAAGHAIGHDRRQRQLCRFADCRRATTRSPFELQGMAPRDRKDRRRARPHDHSVDAEMALAAVTETSQVVAESSPVVYEHRRRRELHRRRDQRAAHRPHPAARRGAGARTDRQHAEHRAAARSPAASHSTTSSWSMASTSTTTSSDRQQSVHRGRRRGDADPDVRHLRRVRPLQRRRRERRHQAWRQPVLRQLPRQPAATRRGATRRRSRPRTAATICSRRSRRRLAGRSSRIGCGSSARSATRTPRPRSRCVETGIPGSAGVDDQRLRHQADRNGREQPHDLRAAYLDNRTDQTDVRGISVVRDRSARALRSRNCRRSSA